jgi:hypothetical protein
MDVSLRPVTNFVGGLTPEECRELNDLFTRCFGPPEARTRTPHPLVIAPDEDTTYIVRVWEDGLLVSGLWIAERTILDDGQPTGKQDLYEVLPERPAMVLLPDGRLPPRGAINGRRTTSPTTGSDGITRSKAASQVEPGGCPRTPGHLLGHPSRPGSPSRSEDASDRMTRVAPP